MTSVMEKFVTFVLLPISYHLGNPFPPLSRIIKNKRGGLRHEAAVIKKTLPTSLGETGQDTILHTNAKDDPETKGRITRAQRGR